MRSTKFVGYYFEKEKKTMEMEKVEKLLFISILAIENPIQSINIQKKMRKEHEKKRNTHTHTQLLLSFTISTEA